MSWNKSSNYNNNMHGAKIKICRDIFTFFTCIYGKMFRSLSLWLRYYLLHEFLFATLQCERQVDVWLRIRCHYVDLIKLNAEERKEGNWEQGLVRDTAFSSR